MGFYENQYQDYLADCEKSQDRAEQAEQLNILKAKIEAEIAELDKMSDIWYPAFLKSNKLWEELEEINQILKNY